MLWKLKMPNSDWISMYKEGIKNVLLKAYYARLTIKQKKSE